jgi:DNA-binding beta-propeller fold protein YncE
MCLSPNGEFAMNRWLLAAGWLSLGSFVTVGAADVASTATEHGSYTIAERISGPGGGWDYAMIDSASRQLYLGRDEGVLAMNLDTKKITPVLAAGEGVHSGLPVPGHILVVTNGDSNKITLFAADSGKLTGTVPAGEMPDAAVFEPKSGLVAVINHKGGSVTLVDTKAPSVVATVTVGGELEFAAAAGDGRLFVNVADRGEIAVIDVPAHKLVKSLKMNGCSDPSGLAYDIASDLLISVCGNGVTKFLHAADGKAVAALKTGAGSDGVILDSDRKVVFVPAGRDGTLAVISLAGGKPTLIQSLKTQKSARLGAVDAKTGNVYLPAGKLGPPVPPNPWPTVLPGTFEFLVVARK